MATIPEISSHFTFLNEELGEVVSFCTTALNGSIVRGLKIDVHGMLVER